MKCLIIVLFSLIEGSTISDYLFIDFCCSLSHPMYIVEELLLGNYIIACMDIYLNTPKITRDVISTLAFWIERIKESVCMGQWDVIIRKELLHTAGAAVAVTLLSNFGWLICFVCTTHFVLQSKSSRLLNISSC